MKSPFVATKVALKGMTFLSASSAETWPIETLNSRRQPGEKRQGSVFLFFSVRRGFGWLKLDNFNLYEAQIGSLE